MEKVKYNAGLLGIKYWAYWNTDDDPPWYKVLIFESRVELYGEPVYKFRIKDTNHSIFFGLTAFENKMIKPFLYDTKAHRDFLEGLS